MLISYLGWLKFMYYLCNFPAVAINPRQNKVIGDGLILQHLSTRYFEKDKGNL